MSMFQFNQAVQYMYDGAEPFALTHYEEKTDKDGTVHGAGTPVTDKSGKQLHRYTVMAVATGIRSQTIAVKVPLDTSKPYVPMAPGFVKLKNVTITPYEKDRALALSFSADALEASPNS
jgi:hypothetical protein